MHHVARGEVFAGILVQGLVELADQLLEDRPHLGIGDFVGVEVYVLEALEDLVQQLRFLQLVDGVVEPKVLQHVDHVRAESRDVVTQVLGQVRVVAEQLFEVVERGVVEGESGRAAELLVGVVELAFVLGVSVPHGLARGREHAVEPTQDGEREDHVLVMAALEGVADEVRDGPDEGDDFGVVHAAAPAYRDRLARHLRSEGARRFEVFRSHARGKSAHHYPSRRSCQKALTGAGTPISAAFWPLRNTSGGTARRIKGSFGPDF